MSDNSVNDNEFDVGSIYDAMPENQEALEAEQESQEDNDTDDVREQSADVSVDDDATDDRNVGIPGIYDIAEKQKEAEAAKGDDAEEAEPEGVDPATAAAFKKYRKRAQAAEEKARELEERLASINPDEGESVSNTQTDAVNSGIDDIDDEDFITGAQVKKTISGLERKIRQELELERQKLETAQFEQKAITSEQAARAKYPDYAQKMQIAKSMPFTAEEKKQIASAADPAITAYELVEKKIAPLRSVLGLSNDVAKETKQQSLGDEGFEDEDEALRAFAGM